MRLGHDLLDQQLVDRRQRALGRVDGVILELPLGGPPRVAAMEVGLPALARRVHPRLGRWVRVLAAKWLPFPLATTRLPLTVFRDVGVDIEIEIDEATERRILRAERWISRHIVAKLPGGKG